jgi:protein gp37
MASRLQAMEHPSYRDVTRASGGRSVWTGKVHLNHAALDIPLKWRTPRMIFVNSMSDLFQDRVPFGFVAKVWEVMAQAPRHTFQVLTKRPERMKQFVESFWREPLTNVWLGTSVESADSSGRIDVLRQTPAWVRFVSFEPLLSPVGSIDLREIHWAIVGGESGPQARPIRSEWVDEISDACGRAGVAFFFKQWGGPNKKATGRTYKGRLWNEYPVPAVQQ